MIFIFFFDVISLTGKANGVQKFETIIPVRLLDSSFQSDSHFLIRYAVGSLGIPSVFPKVKVNNKSIGFPSSVPMCNVSSTSYSVLDPDQPLPSW